jgi:hypothetical protein
MDELRNIEGEEYMQENKKLFLEALKIFYIT